MPTSLRMPVVPPAARCARIPRSSPLQRSSARPIAATAATAGSGRTPASQPTSGRRLPRWFTASGPAARSASSSWRPRCANPAASRPVARWSRSRSTSSTLSPARSASIVIRTSQPNPGASGKHAARARSLRRRWPESGSRAVKPVRRWMSSRATRLAMPNPPPTRCVNAATRRSASPSEGAQRPPQVGVAEEERARRGHRARPRSAPRLYLAPRGGGRPRPPPPPPRRCRPWRLRRRRGSLRRRARPAGP